jgi:reverse gyrase
MEKSFVDDEPSTKNRKIEMFHANTDTESKNRILEEFTKADSNIKVLISTVGFFTTLLKNEYYIIAPKKKNLNFGV